MCLYHTSKVDFQMMALIKYKPRIFDDWWWLVDESLDSNITSSLADVVSFPAAKLGI